MSRRAAASSEVTRPSSAGPPVARSDLCPVAGPRRHRVGPSTVSNGARVEPAVAEVELIDELLCELEPPEGQPASVEDIVVDLVSPLGISYAAAVAEVELVQMRPVPARERVVDRTRQLLETVAARRSEDPSRSRPQVLAPPLNEVNRS